MSDRITKSIGKAYPDVFRGTKVTSKITVVRDSKSGKSTQTKK